MRRTSCGVFENSVHMKDSNRLEAAADHKSYATGAGLVKAAELVLVKIEQ